VVLELPGQAIGQHLAHLLLEQRSLGGREAAGGQATQQLVRAALEQRLGCGVQVREPAFVVEPEHGVGNTRQQIQRLPAPRFMRSHSSRSLRCFGPPAGADVTAPSVRQH
jgi:hypothetical protein